MNWKTFWNTLAGFSVGCFLYMTIYLVLDRFLMEIANASTINTILLCGFCSGLGVYVAYIWNKE